MGTGSLAWTALIVGGLFEVGFTTCLRHVDGFRSLPWTAGFLLSVAGSMGLLEYASRTVPLGIGYAVWTGVGAAGTVLVGVVLAGEPLGIVRGLLVLGLVACAAGLKLVTP